ncbi:aminoacyl--tRNA ligase-related protein [Candidatus Cytomitobacter primus]|uniref:Proline--tRNA ligase n=1 Tax=Candidatus Cytomitobacter primus TaxID=2066024 RepID=A0A5C0UFJ0_9PROT|nr:aminoacyl--tRNA ligase-related protein [Candidatus Cytomitobacter primus]QEK38487.1 proline--tRNA ligase [Candidatus Cytomitobacter primus]
MKASNFFLPIKKEVNEVSISAKLMLKSGMIQKLASGLYSWLPLGYKIISNIENIVSEEFESMGFNRMCIPTLHPAHLWQESERYEAYGKEMLRVNDRKNNEFIYGPSAEEPCVDMVRQANIGKSDLPINLFNIQWKFRDELRPRFGVVRCREFFMCDGYSFHETIESSSEFYDTVFNGYKRIFDRLNLNVFTKEAETGEVGGLKSHEFHVLSEIGEDEIERDGKKHKSLELGHIFLLGDRYTVPMDLKITNSDNKQTPLIMGCYGVGVSRLVAAMVESYYECKDENYSINWPIDFAPFKINIINANAKSLECNQLSGKLYEQYKNISFYDDRNISIGQKFATSDLLGSPIKIIIWPKELKNESVEIRIGNSKEIVKIEQISKFIDNILVK